MPNFHLKFPTLLLKSSSNFLASFLKFRALKKLFIKILTKHVYDSYLSICEP